MVYEGSFKDDKKCGQGTWDMGANMGKFRGRLNEEEELDGLGRFEFPSESQVLYEGHFQDSLFHGPGKLTYLDTGNTYEGEFYQHYKNGPCTFSLNGVS